MEMTFPEYRELLVHIHKEHSPLKGGRARKVKYIECVTDMRSGKVFFVKVRGFGWDKTFSTVNTSIETPLLDRIHSFLDAEVGSEPFDEESFGERNAKAALSILGTITGEIGQTMLEYAEEFGAEDMTFTIPTALVKKAIEDAKNANTGRTAAPDSGAGECAGGCGEAPGVQDRPPGNVPL